MASWFVGPVPERPDFRLVIAFLWGDFHNVDSDGDSHNPASRSWTWLYLMNRENPAEVVECVLVEGREACMRVESDIRWLAAAVAYFLAEESGAVVARDAGGPWDDRGVLEAEMGQFESARGIERARVSVWRRSTLANPYPNQTEC